MNTGTSYVQVNYTVRELQAVLYLGAYEGLWGLLIRA